MGLGFNRHRNEEEGGIVLYCATRHAKHDPCWLLQTGRYQSAASRASRVTSSHPAITGLINAMAIWGGEMFQTTAAGGF